MDELEGQDLDSLTTPIPIGDYFTDLTEQSPSAPVGEHEHLDIGADGYAMRISCCRGATPVEAINAYAEDAASMIAAGWRVVTMTSAMNFIKYVGILATGSSPQVVGQVTLAVTWEKRAS